MLVARKGEEVVIFERASLDNVARSILQTEVHEIGRTQLLLGQRLLVVRPLDDGIAVSLLVKLDRRSRQRVDLHTALGYRLDSDSLRVPLLVGRVARRKRDIVCRTLLQARNLQRIGRSIDALHEVGLRGCGNRQTIVVSALDLVPRERYGRTLDRSREVLRSVERLGALDDRGRSHDLDVTEEEAPSVASVDHLNAVALVAPFTVKVNVVHLALFQLLLTSGVTLPLPISSPAPTTSKRMGSAEPVHMAASNDTTISCAADRDDTLPMAGVCIQPLLEPVPVLK